MQYKVKLDSECERYLSVALVKDVSNTDEVIKKIMEGELKCCMLNPALIVHPFQVAVAANKAAVSDKLGKLYTKSVYSEILYNLSSTRQISQSLKLFGINNSHKNFLIAVLENENDDEIQSLMTHINGELSDLDNLKGFLDEDKVKKHYNISEQELKVSSLLDSVVTRMSAKVVLT